MSVDFQVSRRAYHCVIFIFRLLLKITEWYPHRIQRGAPFDGRFGEPYPPIFRNALRYTIKFKILKSPERSPQGWVDEKLNDDADQSSVLWLCGKILSLYVYLCHQEGVQYMHTFKRCISASIGQAHTKKRLLRV